jgi:hypothetical protein
VIAHDRDMRDCGPGGTPRRPEFRADPSLSPFVQWEFAMQREIIPYVAGPCVSAWRNARWLFIAALPTRADRLTMLFLFAAAVWIGGFVVPALFHASTGGR